MVNRRVYFYSGLGYCSRNLEGVALELSDYVLPFQPVTAGHKHINRLDQIMIARNKKNNRAQESLVLGPHRRTAHAY